MKRFLAPLLLAFFAATTLDAQAAPEGIPDRPMDIELRDAEIGNVFRLLAEVAKRNVILDPCVQGKVDIKLTNTPLPMVFDAFAKKMSLVYEDDGQILYVRCSADPRLDTRVDLSVKDMPLREMLNELVTDAKLEGLDWRTKKDPKVTLTLRVVRLSTAIAAIADSADVHLTVVRGKLVVTD